MSDPPATAEDPAAAPSGALAGSTEVEPPASEDGGSGLRPRAWIPLLVALVLLAFALRTWDASQGLHAGAHFDERFSLRNVAGILERGDWRPVQAFYPSLSYLPQVAVLATSELLHRTTGIDLFAVRSRTSDGWSPTAYLLCRLTNVAFGAASLVLLFGIGKHLFGPGEGLLAAAILAAFPRHILSSTHFKPDILVLLLTLLTFWWTLLAVERPRRRAFLRAGVGVGLAASAKYTGGGAALALVVAVLARFRDRRQWRWLVLAGVAAVVTFVLLNPWVGRLYTFARRLSHGYAAAGVEEGSDRWVVAQREALFLIAHHGWEIAAFLVLGLAWLVWRIARPHAGDPPWDERRRLGATLLLGQVAGFAVLHALGFPLFRGQNFLPVVPFTSLVAAWAMVELWRVLVRRAPRLGRRAVAAVIWSVTALLLTAAQLGVVYRAVVPTTWAAAGTALASELDQLGLRQVVYEGKAGQLRPTRGARGALVVPVGTLTALRPSALDLADAEVVTLRRLEDDPFVNMRSRRAGTSIRVVRARLFTSRGEPVAVLLHPWRLARARRLTLGQAPPAELAASLPAALPPESTVTLGLWLPRTVAPPTELRLEPSGRRLRLFPADRRQGDQRLITGRFRLPPDSQRVVIARPPAGPRPPRLELYRWER